MRLISLLFFFALAFAACTKEQRISNRLDGYWQLVERRVNGSVDTTYSDMIFFFKRCNTSSYVQCQGTVNYTLAGSSSPEEYDFTYDVDWMYKIKIDFDGLTLPPVEFGDILELNKETLKIDYWVYPRRVDVPSYQVKLTFRRIE